MPKHNKIKNTGILFDLLIEIITNSIMTNNIEEEEKSKLILQKYFNNTELLKEYKLYKNIQNVTLSNNKNKIDVFLEDIYKNRKKMNNDKLNNEKYNLNKELNENFDIEELFKKRYLNYKLNASIYNMFEYITNKNVKPDLVVKSTNAIYEHLLKKKENNINILDEFKKIDSKTRLISYKLLIEKFNKKYDNLTNEQKKLLSIYINNIHDSTLLKNNINNNISEFKTFIKENIDNFNIDKRINIKLSELNNRLDEIFKNNIITDIDILNLLRLYELKPELQKLLK